MRPGHWEKLCGAVEGFASGFTVTNDIILDIDLSSRELADGQMGCRGGLSCRGLRSGFAVAAATGNAASNGVVQRLVAATWPVALRAVILQAAAHCSLAGTFPVARVRAHGVDTALERARRRSGENLRRSFASVQVLLQRVQTRLESGLPAFIDTLFTT